MDMTIDAKNARLNIWISYLLKKLGKIVDLLSKIKELQTKLEESTDPFEKMEIMDEIEKVMEQIEGDEPTQHDEDVHDVPCGKPKLSNLNSICRGMKFEDAMGLIYEVEKVSITNIRKKQPAIYIQSNVRKSIDSTNVSWDDEPLSNFLAKIVKIYGEE